MEKRIKAMGNSFGLVIDKPMLRMLGLGRGSVVKLTTDGRRLVIERVDTSNRIEPSRDPRLELEASAVARALLDRFGLWIDDFKRLHHAGWRPLAYIGWLEGVPSENLNAADLETMRRLEACLAECQAGATKEDAIAHALRAHPLGDHE